MEVDKALDTVEDMNGMCHRGSVADLRTDSLVDWLDSPSVADLHTDSSVDWVDSPSEVVVADRKVLLAAH